MQCMKCGTNIEGTTVFCDSCLENMEQRPVKPNVPVNLPNRKMEEKKTSPKKLPPTPEERLSRCHVAIRWLAGLLAVAILLLAVTGAMLVSTARDRGNQNNIGQNYSAVED